MKCVIHQEADAFGTCVYCGKFYCKECLVEINGRMYCKADVSNVVKEAKEEAAAAKAAAPVINVNNVNANTNTNVNTLGAAYYPYKKKITALLLCFFFGWAGIHRFYVGKTGTGILWFFTVGLFGIGWLFDFIFILVGSFRDKAGYPLK